MSFMFYTNRPSWFFFSCWTIGYGNFEWIFDAPNLACLFVSFKYFILILLARFLKCNFYSNVFIVLSDLFTNGI